jgi:hypothetical protein
MGGGRGKERGVGAEREEADGPYSARQIGIIEMECLEPGRDKNKLRGGGLVYNGGLIRRANDVYEELIIPPVTRE